MSYFEKTLYEPPLLALISLLLNLYNLGVRYISQKVNMPLLRLLHQISNMYQNVKDTQNELREQQPVEIRRPKTSASDHVDVKHHSTSSKTQNIIRIRHLF